MIVEADAATDPKRPRHQRHNPAPTDPLCLSRRELFRSLRSPAAAFWGASALSAPTRAADVSADIDPNALVTRLAKRITMGINPSELALAQSLGYSAYLEHHLDHTAIADTALQTRIAPLTSLPMTYQQMLALNNAGLVSNELTEALIVRAQLSNRQLFERIVEFWTDHFNIAIQGGNMSLYKSIDDRDVIRQNALGTFPALLSASAHSPAMLIYLDNNVSVAGNPNENYARELMELHSLGVTGGYTQQDVEEVARCFTGWTVWNNSQGALSGTFRYNNAVHDQGQKTVLGQIIPASGGMQDALTVLNILAEHPSTAAFISKKLCNWLLGPNTPQTIIDTVAAAYTSTSGDIKAMIRAALAPNHLHDSEPKYRRPFHLFSAAMRAVPTTIGSTSSLRSQLTGAGHLPFAWATPDGYPDSFAYWSGLIIPRWNFGASLLNGNISGSDVDTAAFFAGLTTADQMSDRINQQVFAGELPTAERDRLRDYLLPNTPTLSRQREALGLAIAAPSFQWY